MAWLAAQYGITRALNAHVATALLPAVIYARVVLGGLWGLLFLLPLSRGALVRAVLLGLVVSLVMLVIHPVLAGKAVHLLNGTALFIVLLNLVWGMTTACLLWLMRG
jgi:hypothetical protein